MEAEAARVAEAEAARVAEAEAAAKAEAEAEAKANAEADAEFKLTQDKIKELKKKEEVKRAEALVKENRKLNEEQKAKLQEALNKKLKEIIQSKYQNLLVEINRVTTTEQLREQQMEAIKLEEYLNEEQRTNLNQNIEQKKQELRQKKPKQPPEAIDTPTLSEIDANALESLKKNANDKAYEEFFKNLCINSGGSDCDNFQEFIKQMDKNGITIKKDESNKWYFYNNGNKIEDINKVENIDQEGLKTFLNSMRRMKDILGENDIETPIYSEKELIYRMRTMYCSRAYWAQFSGYATGTVAGTGAFVASAFSLQLWASVAVTGSSGAAGYGAGYYGAMSLQEYGNSDFIDYYREYMKNGNAGFVNFEEYFEGQNDLYKRPIPDESSSETFKTPYDYADKGGSSICDGIDYNLNIKTAEQNMGEIFKYMSMEARKDQQDADWSRAFIGFKQDGFKNREDYYKKYGSR